MSITLTITDPTALSLTEKERIASLLGISAAPAQTDYTERLSELIAKEQTLEAVCNMLDVQPGELFARIDLLMGEAVERVAEQRASERVATVDSARVVPVAELVVPSAPVALPIAAFSVPAAPAPVIPAFAALTIPAASAELDVHGLPWDSRIHSVAKTKIADGSWRGKKGIGPTVRTDVEAELRATMAAGGGVAKHDPVAALAGLSAAHPAGSPVASTANFVPTPPPTPVAPVAPALDEFSSFMTYMTGLLAANRIVPAQVQAACAELTPPLPHIGALFTRQDLIPAMRAKIEALVGA